MTERSFSSRQKLEAHVCKFIGGQMEREVKPGHHLVDDLAADSLEIMMFSMQIKQEYDIPDIPEEEMEKMTHVHHIIDYVGRFTLKE